MSDRKIICKIRIGSHLYGTNRPESDEDFSGVFLPALDDLLGMQSCPSEMSESIKLSEGARNEKGDVDCKFYSLQRFLNLAGQGQPGQLELLFAPAQMYQELGPKGPYFWGEWGYILLHRDLFLSRKNIWPFVGFALAQAHKTTIKGDNLNRLRAIGEWGKLLTPHQYQEPLKNWIIQCDDKLWYFLDPSKPRLAAERYFDTAGYGFEITPNDQHFDTFRVAGRQYDPGTKTKTFLGAVQILLDRYGSRSAAAAEHGLDYKSLMHAYRLIGQAEELLETGTITLPRPAKEIEFLKSVRNMEIPVDFDWLGDITARIDRIRSDLEPKSPLPKEPDFGELNKLCKELLGQHLGIRKS